MTAPRILHYPGSKWNLADWIITKVLWLNPVAAEQQRQMTLF